MRKINDRNLSDADLELVSGGRTSPGAAMRGASQNSGNIQLNQETDELFEPQAVTF